MKLKILIDTELVKLEKAYNDFGEKNNIMFSQSHMNTYGDYGGGFVTKYSMFVLYMEKKQ